MEQDYYQIVSEFSDFSLEDIIIHLMAEKELEETPNGNNTRNTPLPKEQLPKKELKKVLKKPYCVQVQNKAKEIANLLTGNAEDYYEICDHFSSNGIDFIVE